MSTAPTTLVRVARSLAGPSDVVTLAARPRGVAHLYVGPTTTSGGFVPRPRRTVCRTHTRRLTILECREPLAGTGRRVCERCTACLHLPRGQAEHPLNRDACLAAYEGLTVADLHLALAMCTKSEQTHRVGFVASLLFGPPPVRRDIAGTPERQALFDLHAAIIDRRRALVAAERTPDEVEAAARQREIDDHNQALIAKGRRNDARVDRALERQARGQYLAPWERPA